MELFSTKLKTKKADFLKNYTFKLSSPDVVSVMENRLGHACIQECKRRIIFSPVLGKWLDLHRETDSGNVDTHYLNCIAINHRFKRT